MRTIYVGAGAEYRTISQALSFSQQGDTIIVGPGTYRENISIVRPDITIQGSPHPITGEPPEFVGRIDILGKNVTLNGFHVRSEYNSDFGSASNLIHADDAEGLIIEDMTIEAGSNFHGQYMRAVEIDGDVTIRNSSISRIEFAGTRFETRELVRILHTNKTIIEDSDFVGSHVEIRGAGEASASDPQITVRNNIFDAPDTRDVLIVRGASGTLADHWGPISETVTIEGNQLANEANVLIQGTDLDDDMSTLGTDGEDSIRGHEGDDTLWGGMGSDFVGGDEGNDVLFGGGGMDVVDGGAGDDRISGGEGPDYLIGGIGADTFILAPGMGSDTILDFDSGDSDGDGRTNDQLDFTAFEKEDGSAYTFDDIVIDSTAEGWARLSFDTGDEVILQSIDPSSFDLKSSMQSPLSVLCFTQGSEIETDAGLVPVENLKPGVRLICYNNGAQPLRWIGRSVIKTNALNDDPARLPILIPEGAMGNTRQILVSRQHAFLANEHMKGLPKRFIEKRLVRANHLPGRVAGVRVASGKRKVTYFHLLMDRHEILRSDGVWSESLFPGPAVLNTLKPGQRRRVEKIWPGLAKGKTPRPRMPYLKQKDFKTKVAKKQTNKANQKENRHFSEPNKTPNKTNVSQLKNKNHQNNLRKIMPRAGQLRIAR